MHADLTTYLAATCAHVWEPLPADHHATGPDSYVTGASWIQCRYCHHVQPRHTTGAPTANHASSTHPASSIDSAPGAGSAGRDVPVPTAQAILAALAGLGVPALTEGLASPAVDGIWWTPIEKVPSGYRVHLRLSGPADAALLGGQEVALAAGLHRPAGAVTVQPLPHLSRHDLVLWIHDQPTPPTGPAERGGDTITPTDDGGGSDSAGAGGAA